MWRWGDPEDTNSEAVYFTIDQQGFTNRLELYLPINRSLRHQTRKTKQALAAVRSSKFMRNIHHNTVNKRAVSIHHNNEYLDGPKQSSRNASNEACTLRDQARTRATTNRCLAVFTFLTSKHTTLPRTDIIDRPVSGIDPLRFRPISKQKRITP